MIRVEEHLIQLGCNYADFTYRFIGDGVDGAPLWQNMIGTPFYANAAADEYVFADCAPLSELYFDQGFNQNDVEEERGRTPRVEQLVLAPTTSLARRTCLTTSARELAPHKYATPRRPLEFK